MDPILPILVGMVLSISQFKVLGLSRQGPWWEVSAGSGQRRALPDFDEVVKEA